MTHVDLLYLAENVTAGHFHSRDNLLTFGDIQFQVLHRLIPPVGDEHEVLEAGMFEFLHDELERICSATYEVSPSGPVCALNIPTDTWHTLRSLESGTVILEVKDGAYEPIRECDILK